LGDTEGEVLTVANLADAALDQSDVRRATSLGREGLLLAREQGDEKTAATCLEVLAGAAAAQGSATDAAWLFGAARAIRDRLDAPLRAGDLPRYHDRVAGARAQLVEARWSASWAAGAAAAPEEAIDRALAVAKRLGRGHD